jgi:hypothetical protein
LCGCKNINIENEDISAGFYYHEFIVLSKIGKKYNTHENNHLYSNLEMKMRPLSK